MHFFLPGFKIYSKSKLPARNHSGTKANDLLRKWKDSGYKFIVKGDADAPTVLIVNTTWLYLTIFNRPKSGLWSLVSICFHDPFMSTLAQACRCRSTGRYVSA